MPKKVLVCLACVFLLSSCQLFQKNAQPKEIIPIAPAPPVSTDALFAGSLELDQNYINKFRLDGFTDPGNETPYLTEKKSLIDSYNAGDRSLNIIRAYIYLTSLEGDFDMKNILEKELCQLFPAECRVSTVNVSISGIVRNSLGEPISDVTVEVLGTKEKTLTNAQGAYSMTFDAHSPTILRLRASTNTTMIDIKKIELDDGIRKSFPTQKFERNFTLVTPFETYQIDTAKKTISGKNSETNTNGYSITTPFTKYSIPYGSIVKNTQPYLGKLTAMVFEFDRASGGYLLDADAFDVIEGFATSLFITYGMPYIIFIAEDGTRLDVLSTNPMFVATTLRERDDVMRTKNFDILYKRAYDESQKQPGEYPINNTWLFANGNLRLIPPWWVLDRSTGFWDNVGMRFATSNPESPYNIEAPFYTIFVGKR